MPSTSFVFADFIDRDIVSTHPLLFPCGNLAKDTVQNELETAGIKVSRVVCYNTLRDPNIEENLKKLTECKVSLNCIVIRNCKYE